MNHPAFLNKEKDRSDVVGCFIASELLGQQSLLFACYMIEGSEKKRR